MKILKIFMTGLSLTLISFVGLAQGTNGPKALEPGTTDTIPVNSGTYIDFEEKRHLNNLLLKRKPVPGVLEQDLSLTVANRNHISPALESALSLDPKEETFFSNKRNVYSSLWAFASLNYLYADLVGVMDKNKLVQYQNGEVEGVKITPKFLTLAGAFYADTISECFFATPYKK